MWQQDRYPSKPIQMLVAYSTGTTTDILARTFAEKLGPRLGHTVTVQNRPGAGSTLAGKSVMSAATARIARDFGREPATTDEAMEIFGIRR